MKTIALSMIFSLVAIVCEQQTLFAPHIIDFATAPHPTNSLVPIAGVNRSIPLAGTNAYCTDNWCVSKAKGSGHNINDEFDDFSPSSSRAIVHPEFSPSGPDRKPTVVEQPVHGPHRLVFDGLSGRGQKGISEEDDADGSSAFLPWHRGYFGITGSASPGGDDI
jgi:hypothetical protein